MEFIIVTGMSGAGKSTAIKFFEDEGYYCVDNLPPALISNFAELIAEKKVAYEKVVIGLDIRGGILFDDFFSSLHTLECKGYPYHILFLDCNDGELVKRYKETRRLHPLAKYDGLNEGIAKERGMLENIKQKADYILDTTYLLPKDTKQVLQKIYENKIKFRSMMTTILVFGFKYGIPTDADLVFDVRFAPNPYYNPELRPFTGNDDVIKDYVLSFDVSRAFIAKLQDMIEFLLPHYSAEGKNQLVIAIGCTGGKHRSVVVGNELYKFLEEREYSVTIQYRDIDKDSKRGK
jgi:UPF0042 nucleotide-binding protein